ncbi:unnamed protein product [Dovyalis caffra]|uniref:Uncharacterized protein n=1 Tax=Dovyalis caffra TaxID=77055 RepID=A0AAV1RUU7_9ROSI|nr:unnamed protein product [Dovyalis caffra]
MPKQNPAERRRKPRQNPAAPTITTIRTHRKETKAFSTNPSHDQNHKMEKIDPTAEPTATWLIVWSPCETRNHVYKTDDER